MPGRDFADVEDIVVPDIYWDYTSRRVLTMEYIDGVKITDYEGMKRIGVDPSDIAKILVFAFAEMIVNFGFFHADPHPGNLMALPGPKLVLIDFGQAKELPPDFQKTLINFTRSLLGSDNAEMGRAFGKSGEPASSPIASRRNSPPVIWRITSPRLVIMKSVRPPRMSTTAGVAPR